MVVDVAIAHLDPEVETLKTCLERHGFDLLIFVDKYNFTTEQEKEMMATAFKEINNADFLIAELTTKSIGVGIEIGYAFSRNKPIIYLRKKNAEYSTTASGSSNFIIEYEDIHDLKVSMQKIENKP